VEARRAERQKLVARVPPIAEQLRQADGFIQERKFEQAQALLGDVVKQHPNNARALYGLAQVVSQVASQIDPAKSADQEAAWEQLMTQLEQAVQLYRRAIAAASAQEEKWLISQAHVAIGKILDFAGEREAAVAEYQKAVELGDVPGGAYVQAKARLEAKD
jgi:tetratricopeptide (TPR) repeat protein